MSPARVVSACLIATAVCSFDGSAQGTDGSATLFEGARLVVGDGSAPIENSAFLVQGDSITWVGKRGAQETPAGATRVDLTGRTVMPSLIDGHNHLDAARRAASGDIPPALFELQCRNLRRIHDAGMVIGMGTDGTGDGFGAHEQIASYTRCGFTAAEALVAATGVNARILGLDRLGVVAVGKEASFNVLDANPLDDITNTRRIVRVYLRGQQVDRQGLRAEWTRAR